MIELCQAEWCPHSSRVRWRLMDRTVRERADADVHRALRDQERDGA